jgi:AraC-like DNA-binding protein
MYQTIRPPEHLNKYIEYFWWGDDLDLPQRPNVYHSVATSKIELLFFDQGIYSQNNNGKDEPVFKAGFYGQTTSFSHYYASAKRTTIFGITFSPLAALKFFKIPANELTHQRLDINYLLGNYGNELSDRIYKAQTFKQKTIVAADFFNSRLKELHIRYLSVEKLILSLDQTNLHSIPDLVSNSFLSQRQFERNFKELTGFSAKTYLKLKRFERFIENASLSVNTSENKLLDIALDLGYYDQAHLNRHFKEFTGLNPKAYFQNLILQESTG